jgi:hypothetical protein
MTEPNPCWHCRRPAVGIEAPISDGRVRIDCEHCGRFLRWGRWYQRLVVGDAGSEVDAIDFAREMIAAGVDVHVCEIHQPAAAESPSRCMRPRHLF